MLHVQQQMNKYLHYIHVYYMSTYRMSANVNPIKNEQICSRQFTEEEIRMAHQHMEEMLSVTGISKIN